ncbi:DNA glycosylase AlkZ-like family protein [Streptomyces sp. NPDC002784]
MKTHGPRGTVHLLPAQELPLWTAALTAIPSGPNPFAADARLTEEQTREILTAIEDALDGACLTIDELSEQVVARTGPWAGDLVMPAFQGMWPRWRQVMLPHSPKAWGDPHGGPGGRALLRPQPRPQGDVHPPTALRPPARAGRPAHPRTALSARLRPATPAHFAKWLAAPAGWAGGLFQQLVTESAIEEVVLQGAPAWVAAGDTSFPSPEWRGVRLLPYFDAYVIAARPRESLFPGEAYRRALAGGQAGNHPVLLVDGVVAGVWHQRRQGRRTTVTVETLGGLTARQRRELDEQVGRVGEVLEAAPELVLGEVTVGPHA